jgi:glutaconyl-CoA/methylmalonyl-CoA decarboxylase subunit gamma
MKLYKVKVNGKTYEVEVESITEVESTPEIKKEAPLNDGKIKVLAPIQGTVLKSNVKVGTEVQKGSVLLVLESMKLENDILAPVTGYVSQVFIAVGQKVELNQLMLIIG